ncbi:MAG: helix-turn-helix domain-containing protein [Thermoleophilia bacterium]|nr:helix-turn-helix domain-containing protein [Thermoleophilia bacterium]
MPRDLPNDEQCLDQTALVESRFVLPSWLATIVYDEGRLVLSDYEAARLLGVSRGSVRQAIAAGDIHVVRLGRRLLVPLIPLLHLVGVEDLKAPIRV